MEFWTNKKASGKSRRLFLFTCLELHRAGDLSGTQAAGAGVHTLGGTVNDRLNAADVGLPSTVGPSVGVRNLDTKGYALTTKITLSHSLHLPSFNNHILRLSQAL